MKRKSSAVVATLASCDSLSPKVARIMAILNQLYPKPPVPLDYTSPFTFLCAVVLSAQTTDGKVNEVTKKLFEVAPTPEAMSAMDVQEVQKIIHTVGLAPNKARFLVTLSKQLLDNFGGVIPSSYEDLETLAGVGHKTASVVRSHVFGIPSLAVDTHIHRLALRWGLSKEERNVNKVQADLCALFPEASWNKVHLQMIYFGREYCPAKGHDSKLCPICTWVNKPVKKGYAAKVSEDVEAAVAPAEDNYEQLDTHGCVSASSTAAPPASPLKKTKSVIYYSDRLAELTSSPLPSFESFSQTP